MADRREQPKNQEEAQLEQLLKSSYGDTPPSKEFQERVLHELDQEFARTYFQEGHATAAKSTQSSTLNGSGPNGDNLHRSIESATRAAQELTPQKIGRERERPRRLIGLRLAMSMAAAASLLFVVAIWNGQNAYGWASMLSALENCGWVQAVSQNSGLSGWVSSRRGVLAIREGEEVAYHDHREQTSSRYASAHQAIYQQPLASSEAAISPGEQLLALLLDDAGSAASNARHGYKVLSESWRLVGNADSEQDVELLVTLRGSDAQRKTYKLRVLLDSQTHLPRTFELLSHDRGEKKTLSIDYPDEGPNSIFAMGVPRETEVFASLANSGEKQTGKARDAEAALLLGRKDQPQENREIARVSTKQVQDEGVENIESRLDLADRDATEKTPELDSPGKKSEHKNMLAKEFVKPSTGKQVVADEIVTAEPQEQESPEETDLAPVAERLAANSPRPTREVPTFDFSGEQLSLAALVEQIDGQLASHWQQQGISVAQPASDTEFLRRVYLDLTGRIPVPFEVYEYLEADPSTRRENLVDQLLSSRDHATHLATVWRKLLLPDGADTTIYGGTGKFDEWLADRFEKNLPYDALVSQLLLAEGRVSDSGPILFYAALKLNPEELAAKTSRTFLGMRMECAQCHDDKFDDSLTQEDFWGFAAHFAQISRPKGKIEMTSSVLRVRDNARGEVMLPDTDEIVPPRMPYKVNLTKPLSESLSRRQQLVEWLTTKQNNRFARATVNRVWQHLFGLGLVEPVDDMRADNLPTCPEVLETLSHDFAARDYDIRRLLRTLVLSEAYQLSSRAASDEPSQSLQFARMNIKSFSADQLYDCINVATEPASAGADNGASGALVRFGNTARQAFIEQFRAPPGQRTDYHAGIPQALTLMHGRLVHGATDLSTSGLLKGINAPFFSGDDERIETLFLSTLSRFPEESELATMLSHVKAATNDEQRMSAFGDILWALLNSAEFTFIH